ARPRDAQPRSGFEIPLELAGERAAPCWARALSPVSTTARTDLCARRHAIHARCPRLSTSKPVGPARAALGDHGDARRGQQLDRAHDAVAAAPAAAPAASAP